MKRIDNRIEGKEGYTDPLGYGYKSNKNEKMLGDLFVPKEFDFSDPSLDQVYKQEMLRKQEKNWVLMNFIDNTNKLQVIKSGNGGWRELKNTLSDNFCRNSILFGAFVVNAIDHNNFKRPKVVYFSFVGSGVHELVKVQANPLKAKGQVYFGAVALALDIQGSFLDDFTVHSIGWKLLNAESSHKSIKFDFGANAVIDCKDLSHNADGSEDDEDQEFSD